MVLYLTPLQNVLGAENRFEFTVSYILEAVFLHKRISAFWFIYNLIIFVIATPLFSLGLKKKWSMVLMGILFLALPMFAEDGLKCVGIWSIAPFYYFCGSVAGKYAFTIFSRENKNHSIEGIVISVASIIILLCNSIGIIVLPILVRQLIVVIYAFSFWIATDAFLPAVHTREYMNHNFIVYAAHPFVQALLVKFAVRVMPKTDISAAIIYVGVAICTIAIIIAFGAAVKKISPKLYSVFSGGR